MISHEKLLSLLNYDKDTGLFSRISKRSGVNGYVGSKVGMKTDKGYIRIGLCGRKYMAQKLAWFYVTGEWVKEVDHKNRIKDDNKFDNLRDASRTQNRFNMEKYRNNTSGFKGVCFRKDRQDWQAHIQVDKKKVHLGFFSTAEEAAAAYDKHASSVMPDFAFLNLG